MLGLIFFLSFCTCTLLIYSFYSIIFSKRKMILRLQHYLNPEKNVEKASKDFNIPWRAGLNAVGKTLGKSKWGTKYLEDIENKLTQAHILLKPEEFIAIEFAVALLAFIIGVIILENFALAIFLALAGLYIPNAFVKMRIKGISKKIDQQLPDTVMLLSNSLKAGYSFMQALDVASKELPPPISLEFQQILKEVNLGVNTEKALEGLSQRTQSEDLKLILLAVTIQRQIGGNLSEILDNISDTIRSRIKIKGEINTLTAQGRMSGMVISIMPVALGFILYMINPASTSMLFTEPIGLVMLCIAVMMELLGIFFIKKIVRIEV